MYRLSGIKSPLVQRLVSNEIIRGFHSVFGADDTTYHFDDDSFDSFIMCSDVLYKVLNEKPELREMIALKLCIMLKAVRDCDYEYTFDEFGEFLLHEMIEYVDDEDMEPYWEPGGTWFERNELRQLVKDIAEEIYSSEEWEEVEPEDKEREIEDTIRAITCFPRLADELEGKTLFSFLFWDTDFALFNEMEFDEVVTFLREDTRCGFTGGKMTKVPLKEEEPKDGEEKK